MTYFKEMAMHYSDSSSVDAFSRLRVSQPYTLLDTKQTRDNLPLFYSDMQLSGSGTSSVWNANESSSTLSVSANTAGRRVRQTKLRGNYQPGKGQLIFCSLVLKTGVAGVKKRVGYFDDRNGLFLEQDGTTLKIVERSYTSGSAVDTVYTQANWNLDKLNGAGGTSNPSGITLDVTKTQIFVIDFEWLGVGRTRYALNIGGQMIPVHEVDHANQLATVYMSNPNLPVRYEIIADGTNTQAASLDHICSSIMSEGGQEQTAIQTYVSRRGTPIAIATQDLYTPIISIRLKSDAPCVRVTPVDIDILSTSNINYEWLLCLNPTMAGVDSASWTDVQNSGVQFDVSRTALNYATGFGHVLHGGYGASSNTIKMATSGIVSSFLTMGSNADDTVDEIVLLAANIDGNNGNIYAGITLKEYC